MTDPAAALRPVDWELTHGRDRALDDEIVSLVSDASVNKCGVISSSYEIIANLLMSDKEFLANKEENVRDVLSILERRAEEEARLILARHEESGGSSQYTEISTDISEEINAHYARLFAFFQNRTDLLRGSLFRKVLLSHLPQLLRDNPKFRTRITNPPINYQCAILAGEIASLIVYRGG